LAAARRRIYPKPHEVKESALEVLAVGESIQMGQRRMRPHWEEMKSKLIAQNYDGTRVDMMPTTQECHEHMPFSRNMVFPGGKGQSARPPIHLNTAMEGGSSKE